MVAQVRKQEGLEESPVATKKRVVESESAGVAAGGAVLNISGRWKLDIVRSDRMDAYLSTMGLSQTAIEAAAKAEQEHATVHVIKQTDTNFQITRRSRMINATKDYKLGEEATEPYKSGSKKVLITAAAAAVTTVTTLPPDKQLIDTRTLEEGGVTMAFEITLITPLTQVTIKRYFKREADVPDDAAERAP
jgi:hypothetical protein